jgi:DNA-binding response OmpR family regulator
MRYLRLNGIMTRTETRLKERRAALVALRTVIGTVCDMRVLVIEDDDAIRSVLERGLRAEGFDVDTCSDGSAGLWRALDGDHAAIVLDLLLPGMNGYAVCERLRAEGFRTPILVLTAKSGDYDQIDLLDLGADDFLTKPASIELIAARLRALIRRGSDLSSNRIARGELSYDLGSRECSVGGSSVVLTSREDQLLQALLLAHGGCLTRQELLDGVWGIEAGVDASNLDIYIRRLRSKLHPVEIENVRGLGYRIVGR